MEEQTKVGTGAAAGIALMALLEPHFFEPYPKLTMIIYLTLIGVTIWGFAPLIIRLARRGLGGVRRMWPQYLMVLCGVGFFIGLIGFLQLNTPKTDEAPPTPQNEKAIPTTEPAPVPSPAAVPIELEALLDFSFEMLPRVSPASGILQIFDVREEGNRIEAGVVNYQMDPSIVVDWRKEIPEWPIFGISKCEITSATNERIFNAVINLDLGIQEMIPDPDHPGQSRSGKLLSVQKAQFRVGRISPHESYVLYFINRTKYLVNIGVPPEGVWQDFSVRGPDFEKKIRLKLGRTEGLHLIPVISAPAPPPPIPVPPNEQGKK